MSQKDIIDEYLRIISTIKEYIEEQVELGFLEITSQTQGSADLIGRGSSADLFGSRARIDYKSMEEIGQAVQNCKGCSLYATRTNTVFGTGNENAKLVFIGEAPGADEDQQGKPFVGRAGQKLTQIIHAMGLSREEVYITNVLKCRPPGNRNPLPEEIRACEPYLIGQLRLIKPKVICALGTFAAQALLNTQQPISKLRGRFHTYQGIKVMPTYHPAFILRNPKFKRDVWEDVQKVKAEYDRQ